MDLAADGIRSRYFVVTLLCSGSISSPIQNVTRNDAFVGFSAYIPSLHDCFSQDTHSGSSFSRIAARSATCGLLLQTL